GLAREDNEDRLRNLFCEMYIPYLPASRGINQVDVAAYQRFKGALGLPGGILADQLKIVGIHVLTNSIMAAWRKNRQRFKNSKHPNLSLTGWNAAEKIVCGGG